MIKNIVTISLIIFVTIVIVILGGAVLLKNQNAPQSQNTVLNQNTATKTISLTELASHNTQDNCWMAIDGKVYDATSYIFQHPGGPGQIIAYCGKDASQVFDSIHSNRARNILTTFYVGNFGG